MTSLPSEPVAPAITRRGLRGPDAPARCST
jgi:hypothetical protein